MSPASLVAIFDIGKTNLKLSFVDAEGVMVDSMSAANRTISSGPYPHLDVDYIWDWFLQALRKSKLTANTQTINVVTHGATAVLVDDCGLALPVLDYEHVQVEEISSAYEEVRDDFAETLSPLLPNGLNLGKQFFWLQKTFPAEFSRTRHILLYPQYWTWRLTGNAATEVTSLGCHTDLWHPTTKVYSDLATAQGWTALFPKIISATQSLGPVLPEIAKQFGLRPEAEVFVGLHDSNASLAPHLIARPDEKFSVISTGTWIICMAIGSSDIHMREADDMLANVNFRGEPIACMRFMGGREFAEISANEQFGDEILEDQIANFVANDIYPMPCFSGQGGPFHTREGRILGESHLHLVDRPALAAVYCALMTDYCLDRLEVTGEVIVEGSFVNTSAYIRCLARLRDKQTVYISSDNTGTVSGAALMARIDHPRSPQLKRIESDHALLNLFDFRDNWRRQILG